MKTRNILALSLVALAGAAGAQEDPWYSGISSGFIGPGSSLGFRGALPGMSLPGTAGAESFTAQKQFGGYRLSDTFAIEGAQTSYGNGNTSCIGEPALGDAYRPCYGSTWSVAGVATFESGLSLFGRLGLHYWQKNPQEEAYGMARRSADDLGSVLGVGVSYEYSKRVTLHAESDYYGEFSNGGNAGVRPGLGLDASVHSIGLSIKF
jgi:hypothetical protein